MRLMRLGLLCAWLLLIAGCAAPATVVEQRSADGVTIALERPERIALLRDVELIVALADEGGRPVDGASVYLDLTMPAHTMGVNQPLAEPIGGGRYRVRTAFSMDGEWYVAVVARVDGREHRASFHHTVAP